MHKLNAIIAKKMFWKLFFGQLQAVYVIPLITFLTEHPSDIFLLALMNNT